MHQSCHSHVPSHKRKLLLTEMFGNTLGSEKAIALLTTKLLDMIVSPGIDPGFLSSSPVTK
jgi:hypothetical protein